MTATLQRTTRKNPQPRQRPRVHSKSRILPIETHSGRSTRVTNAQRAKIYRRAEVQQARKLNLEPSDIEGRALRALHTHHWLDEPDKIRVAQLKGGGSSWPTTALDGQQYNGAKQKPKDKRPWIEKGQRPGFSPRQISDHDLIFGLTEGSFSWFRGLSKRSFDILSLHVAEGWTFQKIGSKYGMSRQRAHVVYGQALKAVITEAVRGDHEI